LAQVDTVQRLQTAPDVLSLILRLNLVILDIRSIILRILTTLYWVCCRSCLDVPVPLS
jgi:hypothetical protein